MKHLILLLLFMNVSVSSAARRGGEDDPTPFPQNQAPELLVGRWIGTQANEEIIVKYLRSAKNEKDRLFVMTYRDHQKNGQGYLYFSDNQMYCGYIHQQGPMYTLCIWKKDDALKSQKMEIRGVWQESLWTH